MKNIIADSRKIYTVLDILETILFRGNYCSSFFPDKFAFCSLSLLITNGYSSTAYFLYFQLREVAHHLRPCHLLYFYDPCSVRRSYSHHLRSSHSNLPPPTISSFHISDDGPNEGFPKYTKANRGGEGNLFPLI